MNLAILRSRGLEARNGEKSRLQIEEGKYLDHLYLISMYAPNPLLAIVTLQELIRSARDEQAKEEDGLDASSKDQEGTTTERQTWPKRSRGEDASAGGNRKHKKLKKKGSGISDWAAFERYQRNRSIGTLTLSVNSPSVA